MVTIRFKGELTMLNGFIMRQGETRAVHENQAQQLIKENPDQWELVGSGEKVEEPQAPLLAEEPEVTEVKPARRPRKK